MRSRENFNKAWFFININIIKFIGKFFNWTYLKQILFILFINAFFFELSWWFLRLFTLIFFPLFISAYGLNGHDKSMFFICFLSIRPSATASRKASFFDFSIVFLISSFVGKLNKIGWLSTSQTREFEKRSDHSHFITLMPYFRYSTENFIHTTIRNRWVSRSERTHLSE